jgi:hypothetical protein
MSAWGQQRTCSEARCTFLLTRAGDEPEKFATDNSLRNYRSLRANPGRMAEIIGVVAGHGLVFTVLSSALAQGYAAVNELVPGFFHFN